MATNLYKAYISGGKATGEYSSNLRSIEDTYSNIELTGQKFAIKREQTDNIIDSLSAGLELASTISGGYRDKKKFESESMPAAQKSIAEKSYDSSKYDNMSYGDFQKSDKFEDYFKSFAPKKVKMSLFESLTSEEPMYSVGDKSLTKSDISLIGKLSESKRLAGLTGSSIEDVINVKKDMYSETKNNVKINNKSELDRNNDWIYGDLSYEDLMGDDEDE